MAVAESEASAQLRGVTPAIVRRLPVAGLLAGVLGILCALASVFSIGLYWLPLATLFSLVALVRSLLAFSFAGVIMAILSCLLTIFAVVTSPEAAGEISKLAADGVRTSAALFASRSFATAAQPMSPTMGSAPGVTKTVPSQATPPAEPAAAAEHADTPSADPPKMGKVSSSHTPEAVAAPATPVSPPAAAPVKAKPSTVTSPASPGSPEPSKQADSGTKPKAKASDWPDDSVSQVRAIQLLLEDLDLYHGTTRGTLGPSTRTAIRTFQRANGEPETGEPSEALFRAMQKKKAAAP